jgi:hypothetical protein
MTLRIEYAINMDFTSLYEIDTKKVPTLILAVQIKGNQVDELADTLDPIQSGSMEEMEMKEMAKAATLEVLRMDQMSRQVDETPDTILAEIQTVQEQSRVQAAANTTTEGKAVDVHKESKLKKNPGPLAHVRSSDSDKVKDNDAEKVPEEEKSSKVQAEGRNSRTRNGTVQFGSNNFAKLDEEEVSANAQTFKAKSLFTNVMQSDELLYAGGARLYRPTVGGKIQTLRKIQVYFFKSEKSAEVPVNVVETVEHVIGQILEFYKKSPDLKQELLRFPDQPQCKRSKVVCLTV